MNPLSLAMADSLVFVLPNLDQKRFSHDSFWLKNRTCEKSLLSTFHASCSPRECARNRDENQNLRCRYSFDFFRQYAQSACMNASEMKCAISMRYKKFFDRSKIKIYKKFSKKSLWRSSLQNLGRFFLISVKKFLHNRHRDSKISDKNFHSRCCKNSLRLSTNIFSKKGD